MSANGFHGDKGNGDKKKRTTDWIKNVAEQTGAENGEKAKPERVQQYEKL